jgi:hypothetical protein
MESGGLLLSSSVILWEIVISKNANCIFHVFEAVATKSVGVHNRNTDRFILKIFGEKSDSGWSVHETISL